MAYRTEGFLALVAMLFVLYLAAILLIIRQADLNERLDRIVEDVRHIEQIQGIKYVN